MAHPSHLRSRGLALAVATLLSLAGPAAHAQVTVADKVPSLDELQRLLGAGRTAAPAPAPSTRGRGIEWNAGGAAAPAGAATTATTERSFPTHPAKSSPSGGDAGGAPAVAMPINFELNSTRITPASMPYVDVMAQLLTRNPQLQLTIEGHTDAAGPAQRNLLLSWDRALAVYRLLVERYGIDGQRLQPVGRGPFEPLEGMTPESPSNRRVQFLVIG